MNDDCCEIHEIPHGQRRVLHAVLWVNVAMFLVESVAGILAHSTTLFADSVDMLGDAIVYGFSLYVIGRGILWQARGRVAQGRHHGGVRHRRARPGNREDHTRADTCCRGDGSSRSTGVRRQHPLPRRPVAASRRRHQYAVGVDLLAERRYRQRRCSGRYCGSRGHGLAVAGHRHRPTRRVGVWSFGSSGHSGGIACPRWHERPTSPNHRWWLTPPREEAPRRPSDPTSAARDAAARSAGHNSSPSNVVTDRRSAHRRDRRVRDHRPTLHSAEGKNVHVRVKRVENAEVTMIRTYPAHQRISVKRTR